jgi:predicted MFS family arabinose efflux permease
MGLIEAGYNSIVLLVAIRHFQATDTAKSLLAGGTAIGFLMAPAFLLTVSKIPLRTSHLCALCMLGTATGTTIAAVASDALTYTAGLLIALILVAQVPPLMVHIYTRNYHKKERGRRLSGNLMISSTIGASISLLIGQLLDHNLSYYQHCLLGMSIASICAAYIHLRIPSHRLREEDQPCLRHDLKSAFKDKFFAAMLFAWMLMGVGNLITIPLRVEYVANPLYGIDATNTIVLLITVIVPSIARVLSTPVWAYLFDHFNLARVRISINLCFLTGLFLYFHSSTLSFLLLSAALVGWATGGGTLAWTLWVTKVAPPGSESTYMSVHSFFTGVRGVPAPFIGYWILSNLGPTQVAWTSALFIALSSALFCLMASNHRLQ